MQLLKTKGEINFMGWRRAAMILSLALVLLSIAALVARGLNFGIDFTGGTLLEAGYQSPVELSDVRARLDKAGFTDAVVQHFGTARDVLIRVAPREDLLNEELADVAFAALQQDQASEVERRRVEFVGPQVGDELTEQGGLAVLYALFGILIYVALRFEYRFAIGSVIALVHDVVITLGVFALLQLEFDLTVLAAILAVIGYSLNDTIVVYDRIRENFRKMRKGSAESIINRSLNQTLARTIMTSVTTLIVLVALFFLGGEIIHGFATALLIGVLIGTYSSIYVASSAVLAMGVSKADLMPVQKEGAVDSTP